MSSKIKKDLTKCKEHAQKIEKILDTNKAIVDADFLVTIKNVIERIDNELQPSNIKGVIEDTGKNPIDDLVKVLADYDTFLTKIHAEQKLKRYMQSTRVRRNLDHLNTALYGLVRSMVAKIDQFNASKKKKDKDVKPKKKKNAANSIEDIDGRKLWEEYFEDECVMVEWSKFTQALARKIEIDEEGLLSLRYVLDNSGTGEVTLLKFNEFLKAFGPFKDCVQNLRNVVTNRWFHGFLTSEEAERLLELQPVGTFLIRFSRSQMGSFALAFVDGTRRINHTLIHFCPPNGYSINENDAQGESNRVFNNLEALIRHYNYILKNPFNSTITRESWFHGDVNNDEAADLLKSKPEGTFLFRFSSRKGYLTVSFISEGQLQHTLIQPTTNGYICNGRTHGTLQEVVDANADKFKLPLETLTFITVPKYEKRVDNQRVQTPTTYISIPMSSPGSVRANTQQSGAEPSSTNYASVDLAPSSTEDPLEKSSSKKKKYGSSSSKDKKDKTKNKDKDKEKEKRRSSFGKRSSKAHIQQPLSARTESSYIDTMAMQQAPPQVTTPQTPQQGTQQGEDGYIDAKNLRKNDPPVNINNVNANNVDTYNLGVPQDMQGENNPYDVIPFNTPARDGPRRENSQKENVPGTPTNDTSLVTSQETRYSVLDANATSPVANNTKRMSEARIAAPSQYGVLPVTPVVDDGVDVVSDSESDEQPTVPPSDTPSYANLISTPSYGLLAASGETDRPSLGHLGSNTTNGTNRMTAPAQYGVLPVGGEQPVVASNTTNATNSTNRQAPSQYGVLPTGDSSSNMTNSGGLDNRTNSGPMPSAPNTGTNRPNTATNRQSLSQYGVLPTGDSTDNMTNRTNSSPLGSTTNSTNSLGPRHTPSQYGVLPTGDSSGNMTSSGLSSPTLSANNMTNATNGTNRQAPSQYGVLPTGDSSSNMTNSGGLDNRTNSGPMPSGPNMTNATNSTARGHTPSQYGVLPPSDPNNTVSPRRKESDSSNGITPRSGSSGAGNSPMMLTNKTNTPSQYGVLPPSTGSREQSPLRRLSSSNTNSPMALTNKTHTPSQYGALPESNSNLSNKTDGTGSNSSTPRSGSLTLPANTTNKLHTPSQYGVLPPSDPNTTNKRDSAPLSPSNGTNRTGLGTLSNTSNRSTAPSNYASLPPSNSNSNLTNDAKPQGQYVQGGYIDTSLLSARPANGTNPGNRLSSNNLTNPSMPNNTSNRPTAPSNYATLPPTPTPATNGSYIDMRNLSNGSGTPPSSMNVTAPGGRTQALVADDKLSRRNSDNTGTNSPLGFSTERAPSAYVNTAVLNGPKSNGPNSLNGGYIDTKQLSAPTGSGQAPNSGPPSNNYVDLANLSQGRSGSKSPMNGSGNTPTSYVDTSNISPKGGSYVDTTSVPGKNNGSYVDTSNLKAGNASGATPPSGYVDTTLLKDSKDKDKKDKKKDKHKK